MRRRLCLILTAALFLTGCGAEEAADISELELWTTSQVLADAYEELAGQWNQEMPDRQIRLNIKVYSMERIAGKMSRLFLGGRRFGGEEAPDLVEMDYLSFGDCIREQKADFYPLQNMLTHAAGERYPGTEYYSRNNICFALPYCSQDLVLCYRTEVEELLPDFAERAATFEGLLEMGAEYAAMTGEGLLAVDYLGSETFLALYLQAKRAGQDAQAAYEQSVDLLKRMKDSGASEYLSSGNAYGDAFEELMVQGRFSCLVTTRANFLQMTWKFPEAAEAYEALPLPSFSGQACSITVPTVGMAVYMAGEDVILARDFLEYSRFSGASAEYPLLHLATDGGAAGEPVFSMELSDYISRYGEEVLGSGKETGR